jgi:hypothetical protein
MHATEAGARTGGEVGLRSFISQEVAVWQPLLGVGVEGCADANHTNTPPRFDLNQADLLIYRDYVSASGSADIPGLCQYQWIRVL